MMIALMADIHANREAFEACLAHARVRGARRWVFLGDHVNYGADPQWVVETLMDHLSAGSIGILGNHDAAVGQGRSGLDVPAEIALDWTRSHLQRRHRDFLAGLPLTYEEADRLFVHADASGPRKWNYVTDTKDAARSLLAAKRRVTFCGHVHRPAIYSMSQSEQVTQFEPVAGIAIRFLPQRRWLAVLGSVGQPRDGNPAASYALFETDREEITYFRVPYDVESAAAKIREAGLPEALAERLRWGH
jgi:diadenosine tetraphosphatase ApaH/serine/threonine PP2A family protein phosphatase